ncbi:MAG: signal peptidase II [Dehalococcoidia bacterium]|nr:signal peptidase II [Dehalococcoidia bacterium]
MTERLALSRFSLARASAYTIQKIPFFVGVAALGVDQLSKSLVRESLPLGASIPAEGLVRLRHVANGGVIFGVDAHPAVSLILPSILMIASLFLCWRYVQSNNQLLHTALALFFFGGLGNLIDRMVFGNVTDFIDVSLPGGMIGVTFNVADLSVVIGAILFAVFAASLVRGTRDHQPQPEAP